MRSLKLALLVAAFIFVVVKVQTSAADQPDVSLRPDNSSTSVFATPSEAAEARAKVMFQRLTGAVLSKRDPRLRQMSDLILDGRELDAIAIAMEHPGFLNFTVRSWAASLLTNGQNPLLELNDSLAMMMGSVRDNLDARLLLTGNFIYGRTPLRGGGVPSHASNTIFDEMEASSREPAILLYQYSPQWNLAAARETAGLLTTRWWSSKNYSGGTNRIVIPNVMEAFLCKKANSWKEPNLSTFRIRQDIDRFPQHNTRVFQTQCRSCHAPMDAMAGAFAKIDFTGDRIVWSSDVRPKYVQHSEMYPDGYVTSDESWINLLTTPSLNSSYGWSGPTSGRGILEFAQSIADSRLFSECMTARVFAQVCGSKFGVNDQAVVDAAADFRQSGYQLKTLFQQAALDQACQTQGAP